jgi:hypothetical protein
MFIRRHKETRPVPSENHITEHESPKHLAGGLTQLDYQLGSNPFPPFPCRVRGERERKDLKGMKLQLL